MSVRSAVRGVVRGTVHPFGEFFRPAREERWNHFPKHFLKALLWIAVLAYAVFRLEASGMLKGFDTAGLDSFLRVHTRLMSNNIIVVEITDQDYAQMFGSRSPLCRNGLLRLVANVKSYEPAVVGVDIDTSDPSDTASSAGTSDWCADDAKNSLGQLKEDPHKSAVIWAEVPSNSEEPLNLTPVLAEKKGDPVFERVGELIPPGAKNSLRPEALVGIPRFPLDSDGLVRRYESCFTVEATLESGSCSNESTQFELQSLARRLVEKSNACANPRQSGSEDFNAPLKCPIVEASEKPVIFNFYGDRYRFPIIDAHEFTTEDSATVTKARKSLFSGKIVLIGGTYKAARDVYPTPLGQMAGVELNALAAQSDLSGGGIRDEESWQGFLADLGFGSLVVLVFFAWARHPWSALAIAFVGLSAGAILLSILLFNTSAYFLNFMAVIVGMMLHQSIELAHQAGHFREKLEATKDQVRKLSSENKQLSDQLVLTNLLWESRERDWQLQQERDREAKPKARSAGTH
jgi:CHASE2 domain-containing sensor protein